jgi:hypothetical protein
MTVLDLPLLPTPSRRLTDTELHVAQLAGIQAWHAWRQRQQDAYETQLHEPGLSREARLDITRRLTHLNATRTAFLTWVDGAQYGVLEQTRGDRRPRAVLAHRNDWLRKKVGEALDARGVHVIASVDDGAGAVAAVVCEQPELLLVEDLLPQVPGHEVVLHARDFSPGTLVGVHAESSHWMGNLLDAGARAWFSRRIPPADIAARLTQVLADSDAEIVMS